MQEITLLEAIYRLRNHKKKSTRLVFVVTFDDSDRNARFGKKWDKAMTEWRYLVQEEEHAPCFSYNEKAAVTAITSIARMKKYGNIVNYHIFQECPEVAE